MAKLYDHYIQLCWGKQVEKEVIREGGEGRREGKEMWMKERREGGEKRKGEEKGERRGIEKGKGEEGKGEEKGERR